MGGGGQLVPEHCVQEGAEPRASEAAGVFLWREEAHVPVGSHRPDTGSLLSPPQCFL